MNMIAFSDYKFCEFCGKPLEETESTRYNVETGVKIPAKQCPSWTPVTQRHTTIVRDEEDWTAIEI